MRLHRLELTGFGPFRQTQSVDFEAFERDGVFLISGRTGAGKSSILDGVAFALYGTVPRYEGGERRLRSDHSQLGDPTEVRLEFTVADRRWRIVRAPDYERPAKRGGGLTTEPARAELDELVDGAWIGRAAKPRDVALALDEVLGLNAQQFQQVILLAQNRFSRFLLARNDERQQLLRTLFGTRRFEQYKDDLEQRRRDAQRLLDAAGEQARTLLRLAEDAVAATADAAGRGADVGDAAAEDVPAPAVPAAAPAEHDIVGRRDALDRARQRARYRVEQSAQARAQADAEATAASATHAERVALIRTLDDLSAARSRLAGLEDAAAGIADAGETLAHARAAEALRAPIDAVSRAETALSDAAEVSAAADAEWAAVSGGGAGDAIDEGSAASTADAVRDGAGGLAAVVDALTGDIARWTEALSRENALHEARASADRLAETVEEMTGRLAALDEQRARMPAERDRVMTELEGVAAIASRDADLTARRDELAVQLAAALEARTLAVDLDAAEADYATRTADAAEAMSAVALVLQRRLAGHAAELAAALVDGEPCSVCGATAHPHPAEPGELLVTDDDLAAAETARDTAVAAARSAEAQTAVVRAAHAAATARAGGRGVDELETQLAAATDLAVQSHAAAARVAELTARRDELDALDAAAAAERSALAAGVAAEREKLAALSSTVDALTAEITAARGDFASVAARVDDARARREAARAAVAAAARHGECERALATARADLDERIAGSDFDDVDTVRAALRDAAEQQRLDAMIGEHRTAVESTRARLLDLELAVAGGDERPDLEASQREVQAADARRDAAIASSRDAQNALGRLDDLLERIDAAVQGSAEIAETAAVVTRLADTVAGRAPNTRKMDLETFVLAAELEEIVAAANLRLREMSSGRYTLHHSDALQARGAASGLALDVLDAHTGRLRSPQSLSGGETFLASLALALGLAEVVTSRAGGLRLDTLFVDEGFGSLDPETLELAMRTLDELRAGGRTVGVISHVETMKEQLPAQVVVEATPEGPSIIRQDASFADRAV